MSVDLSELEEKLVEKKEAISYKEARSIAGKLGEFAMTEKQEKINTGVFTASAVSFLAGVAGMITDPGNRYYFTLIVAGATGLIGSTWRSVYDEKLNPEMLKVDESLYEGEEATVDEVFRNYQERK